MLILWYIKAFLKAWNDTCNAETGQPTMLIPRKEFFLRPTSFSGPCKSQVYFAVSHKKYNLKFFIF